MGKRRINIFRTEAIAQGRAQLVAHIGEELRFVLAGLGKVAALVLDFVEQAHVLDGDRGLVGEGRGRSAKGGDRKFHSRYIRQHG